MKTNWFIHNTIAHPVMSILDTIADGLDILSDTLRNLADVVHDKTCPLGKGDE